MPHNYVGEYETEEGINGNKEMLYMGYDAYSAPGVYMKQNGGSWQLYYIIHDYQGVLQASWTIPATG